jgi:hypothetical protein
MGSLEVTHPILAIDGPGFGAEADQEGRPIAWGSWYTMGMFTNGDALIAGPFDTEFAALVAGNGIVQRERQPVALGDWVPA